MSPQPDPGRAVGGCPASTQRWSLPDSATLRTLRADVGDPAAVDQFVSDFLGLIEQRLERLAALLADDRVEAAETLLLSLESSAHMIGADELSESAFGLRRALEAGGVEATAVGVEAVLQRLREASTRLLASATLIRTGPAAPSTPVSPVGASPDR